MAAYVIADVEVIDAVSYKEYSNQTLASLEPFGGKFIVRGGAVEVIEGEWQPKRLVVIEFENMERAKSWYASPFYESIMEIRHRTTVTNMVMVEGA